MATKSLTISVANQATSQTATRSQTVSIYTGERATSSLVISVVPYSETVTKSRRIAVTTSGPSIVAGPNFSVEAGQSFTLSPQAEVAGAGTITNRAWSINTTVISNNSTVSLVGPITKTGVSLTYVYSVTDSNGATAYSPITVNVRPANLRSANNRPLAKRTGSALPGVIATPSSMPATEPTGFSRVFSEDFTTAVPLGGFAVGAAGSSTDGRLDTTHPYYSKLNLYPDNQGYAGDLGNGRYYTSKTVSTTTATNASGVLDWFWHSENFSGTSRALSGWVRPIIPGETQQNRLGGRFSVRMRADATSGYGAVQLLISDNWPMGGEEDWPEGPSTESPVHGFRHFADPNATSGTSGQYQQQVNAPAGTLWTDWHVYTIEWIPGTRMRYLVDGTVVHDSTDRVPNVPMKYVIQSGINGSSVPDAAVSGHLQIDWMTVANYTG